MEAEKCDTKQCGERASQEKHFDLNRHPSFSSPRGALSIVVLPWALHQWDLGSGPHSLCHIISSVSCSGRLLKTLTLLVRNRCLIPRLHLFSCQHCLLVYLFSYFLLFTLKVYTKAAVLQLIHGFARLIEASPINLLALLCQAEHLLLHWSGAWAEEQGGQDSGLAGKGPVPEQVCWQSPYSDTVQWLQTHPQQRGRSEVKPKIRSAGQGQQCSSSRVQG